MKLIRINVDGTDLPTIAARLEASRGRLRCESLLTISPYNGYHYAMVPHDIVAAAFVFQLRRMRIGHEVITKLPAGYRVLDARSPERFMKLLALVTAQTSVGRHRQPTAK